MYYFLALLTGILITVLVTFNGGLTDTHGLYSGAVMIHSVGFVVITVLMLAKRELPWVKGGKRVPLHLYFAGVAGVVTVLLTNFAFGNINVSAILALGLFGQSLGGIVVDQYGLFGMKKHPFSKSKLIGLTLMLLGIVVMIGNFEGRYAVPAALAAFFSGASIVTSRVFNARLAAFIGTRRGVFFNHVVGLAVVVPLLLLLGKNEAGIHFAYALTPSFYIYLGGAIGVAVIMLDNITAVRIPAFYLALLLFVGQVSSGLAVDWVIEGVANPRNMIGGALVAVGLCLNVWLERKR